MKVRHIALAAAIIGMALNGASAQPRDNAHWVGSWGYVALPLPPGLTPALPIRAPEAVPLAAPAPVEAVTPPPRGPLLIDNPGNVPVETALPGELGNVTLRELVRVSVGSKRLRLRFSNEDGSDTFVLGAVHVGIAGADGNVMPGSDHAVTFDGHQGVALPAGAPILSDPVDLPTDALDRLCISIHVPGTVPHTGHSLYQYVAGIPGDYTAQAQLPQPRLMRVPAFVSEVESDAPGVDVVVTLGDSITEGAQSTANAFRGWPDRLAERLAADRTGRKWAVVNAGIGGNRLLRYGTGPDALARLDRDVLSVPGVKTIILLEGINDIGRGFTTQGPTEPVTAEALEAADKQIVARAHEHGIRVIGATLTPYKGANYASKGGEAVRTALNDWIKTGGAFDGVIDFAPAVADPADPLSFARQYNDRDHLHPNDAGYQAMANAIDLKLITGK
jgi:lysophospholipase L1-like esterase